MSHPMKRAASLFLAVLMLMSVLCAQAAAAEPGNLPQSDSPMICNTTDSSKMPAYPADLGDVYGQVDTERADKISSMFSAEAWDRFSEDADRILNFSPVKDSEVAPVLGSVETFLNEGGLAAYLESGSLMVGTEIGLSRNKREKVQILGADANASGWVYVVDKDAVCFIVQDQDGEGIPNALVTISYLDAAGKRVTKSVVATDGHTPGIAAFDGLPEAFFGLVDIQAGGYRAVSILDKEMGSGEHYTVALEKSRANDLYIRGVDLAGCDLVNEERTLSLMDRDTENLTLKVLVTKSGSAAFPDSIEIRSDNRGKTVLTVSRTSGYDYDSNTRVYIAEKRWVEQDAGLLQEDDEVSVRFGGEARKLEHLTVENALFEPGTRNTDMPLTSKPMDGNVSDRLGGSGFLNHTMQILQVPITVGFFPDGNMILMASYDITQLAPDMQTKYSSLFEKSWNPKNMETSQNTFEVFQRSFWENAEKVKGGKAALDSADKVACLTNKNYNFSMSFSVFLRSNYDPETQDSYGSGGIMFSGSLAGGVTEYFLFAAGPVIIPAYIGFEAGIAVNTSLNVNFSMDKPPVGHENDTKWKYANNGDNDWSGRIEVIVSFSVFGGVGVKGVLGASATGYVNFDNAVVLGKGSASIVEDPHSFIDVFYGLRFEYYLLFYSGQINLDCAKDAKRIWDSDWPPDSVAAQAPPEIEFTEMDLAACADRLVPVVGDGGADHDPLFMAETEAALEGRPGVTSIDSSTYPDTQIQFAATKNYTALFRIASTGERTDIYYQRQNRANGDIVSGICKVALPEGETRSVTEFVVVPNKTDGNDPENCDKVYIGAILADSRLQDEEARIRSTDVAAIVVDLDRQLTTSSVIASDPHDQGSYIYSAPMPAGREDYCSVAYAATYLRQDNGERVTSLKALMGVIPGYTSYVLSSCEPGAPAARSFKALGSNKVHCSGVIAPNEPSYWTVDPYRSSDKWLVVNGYGANGYYSEDLRCNFRIDIDGVFDPAEIGVGADFDGIITNWQYLNGCNYFIAGDSVYWMDKHTRGSDPADYEWVVEKVQGSEGIVSVDNRYAMITNNNQSAVYIIGVIGDYEVDVEAGTAAKAANRAQIYTLTTDKTASGGLTCTMHGPLTLKFASGDPITCFTAAYNPDECAASGLSIAYSTPITTEGSRYVCSLRLWKQSADKGLLVTNVKIPDYLIKKGEPYIDLYVTVRNYGYGRENPVPYTIRDESGVLLTQVVDGRDVGEHFYTGADLYPGDSRVEKIQIRPNPDWGLNEEHEIVVEVKDSYRYHGNIDDVVNSAPLQADNTTFTAKNALIGGKHFVSTSITNNTFVGAEPPVIQAVFDYVDSGRTRTMKFPLPTREKLYMYDAARDEAIDQAYHYDIDMEPIWTDDLRGISFSLVSADGAQQSNEVVYVQNPLRNHPAPAHDCPSAVFTDFDPDAWYHEAVDYAVLNGLMNGVADDRFDPDGVTTRAMLVTILYRLEKEPAVSGKCPFDDVRPGQWYTDAVTWASGSGIVEGYGEGRFGPTDTLTREQFATILLRYAKYKGRDTAKTADLSGYTDAPDISAWALDAMRWANAEGLITGRTETTLVPKGNATRAEAAAILMRFIESGTGG